MTGKQSRFVDAGSSMLRNAFYYVMKLIKLIIPGLPATMTLAVLIKDNVLVLYLFQTVFKGHSLCEFHEQIVLNVVVCTN